MATRTITSRNGRNRLIISTINTHIPLFHECGYEYETQIRRRKNYQWWNPFSWGGGFEWVSSNNALQPAITSFLFFMGNGNQRNPIDFLLTESVSVGKYKTSAISANVSNPPANDVSWITRVTLDFEYENRTYNLQ